LATSRITAVDLARVQTAQCDSGHVAMEVWGNAPQ
jgi:hypothetical protein